MRPCGYCVRATGAPDRRQRSASEALVPDVETALPGCRRRKAVLEGRVDRLLVREPLLQMHDRPRRVLIVAHGCDPDEVPAVGERGTHQLRELGACLSQRVARCFEPGLESRQLGAELLLQPVHRGREDRDLLNRSVACMLGLVTVGTVSAIATTATSEIAATIATTIHGRRERGGGPKGTREGASLVGGDA